MDTSFLTVSQHKLILPTGAKEQALLFVQKQAADTSRDSESAPFRRLVDFWMMSIVSAVTNRIPPTDADGDAFVSIGPTSKDVKLDSSLRELLVLIAIWHLRPTRENVPSAASVVDVCNRFAAAGADSLLIQLREGSSGADRLQPPAERFAGVVKNLLQISCTLSA